MTASETQHLFDQTLIGDYETDAAWDAVFALQRDGSRETFVIATQWLKAEEPLKRARAAAILAQLRELEKDAHSLQEPKWLFRDEAFALIVQMVEFEVEVVVLDSGISALGHLGEFAGIPVIIKHKEHPDRNVRFSVAFALGCLPDDVRSVSTMISLTRDQDSGVRDWSVFGLGVRGSSDSREIRETLLACLSDADENVREEAAVGLGKRQDTRVITALRRMLDEPELKVRVAEAASALLGLPEDPVDWEAADYLDALKNKFGEERIR